MVKYSLLQGLNDFKRVAFSFVLGEFLLENFAMDRAECYCFWRHLLAVHNFRMCGIINFSFRTSPL